MMLRSLADKSLTSFEKLQPTEIRTAASAVALLAMPGHGQIRLPVVKSQTAHPVQAELSGPDEYSESPYSLFPEFPELPKLHIETAPTLAKEHSEVLS